ncbi:hypothetical protein OSTOST_22011 [Ostertagia ostertagi]
MGDKTFHKVSELYRSSTLDELVHNSHLAAKHFQEVGLMESAVPLIDVAPSSNGYIVNFVVKEPKAFSLGLKAGISTNGDADMSLNAGKQSVGGRGEAINSSYTYTVKLWRTLRATDDAAFLVREHAGHTTKFSIENAIGFDSRDRPILASKGILGRFLMRNGPFCDILTISRYIKICWPCAFLSIRHQIDLQVYFLIALNKCEACLIKNPTRLGIISRSVVNLLKQAAAPLPFGFILSASAQLKNVKGLGDREIHLLDRMYLGGQQDVRGFGLNTLGVSSSCSFQKGNFTVFLEKFHQYCFRCCLHMCFINRSVLRPIATIIMPRSTECTKAVSMVCNITFLGVAFIFRNIFRLEINYVAPIKHCEGDSHSTGLHIGCGINFL